ncbi:hypothetical protein DM02DRAFT_677668 [Periconia macrospinosa]|uniref:Uncharacterized protein n=1 Tax=Periconia macrospinosa TaxID=97972 RepID=A0A2V1D2G2_9PLEO|nr:hypothetical protein DM02DRAFT_677668 [Periconia macrospinosa]
MRAHSYYAHFVHLHPTHFFSNHRHPPQISWARQLCSNFDEDEYQQDLVREQEDEQAKILQGEMSRKITEKGIVLTHQNGNCTISLRKINKENPAQLNLHLQSLIDSPFPDATRNWAIFFYQSATRWFMALTAPLGFIKIDSRLYYDRVSAIIKAIDRSRGGGMLAPASKNRKKRAVKHQGGKPRTDEARKQSSRSDHRHQSLELEFDVAIDKSAKELELAAESGDESEDFAFEKATEHKGISTEDLGTLREPTECARTTSQSPLSTARPKKMTQWRASRNRNKRGAWNRGGQQEARGHRPVQGRSRGTQKPGELPQTPGQETKESANSHKMPMPGRK